MNEQNKYIVSATPHIRSTDSIEEIMKDVLYALAPASLMSVYFFGLRAALIIFLSISSCIVFEWLFQNSTKRPITIFDCSAAVTGLLLALNLPASSPFWMPIVGAFFAIFIAKQLFGGLGQNFINPALAARAFLQISFAQEMTDWTAPIRNPLSMRLDAISTATPLALLKEGANPSPTDFLSAALGNTSGSLGETCAIALLIGGLYLIYKKIISWHIPVSYILTFAVLNFIFGRNGLFTGLPHYEILVGGIMLGAFFMATDYSSSPINPKGQIIMGVGCGVLTALIRTYGGYPEGVCYSILLMNLAVPLIDKYTPTRVFGTVEPKKIKEGADKNA